MSATTTQPATQVIEQTRTQPQPQTGGGGGDQFAHYVRKDKIVESAVTGTPVTALCGKVWQPSRDPRGLTVCPVCAELHALHKEMSDS